MRKWNKLLAMLLAVVMSLGLATVGFAADSTGSAATPISAEDYSDWDTIKVFETTDVHGWMLDVGKYVEDTFQYRLARIAKIVNDARASEDYEGVLLLDTGDIYQGTPQSSLTRGAGMLAAFDAMKYDAVGLGNHEFDWDVDVYAADSKGTMAAYELDSTYKGDSDIPVLAYNIYDAGTTNSVDFTQDYTVVDKGGYKVAILGYVENYRNDIMAEKINPYTIDDDLTKLAAKASEVKESTEADVLVVLAHADPEGIAAAMDPEVVDLVAGGHTHQKTNGVAENGVPYMQGYRYGFGYATTEIKINPETKDVAVTTPEYVSTTDTAEDLYYKDGKNELLDPEIVKISRANWDAVKEGLLDVLVTADGAITKTPIAENTTTTTAGNWMAGVMLAATKDQNTVATFINSGGIRTELTLEEGETTREISVADVYTIAPFDNLIYVYSVTGKKIAEQVEAALQGSYENSNFGDQFSGITVEYYNVMEDGEKTGIKVTKITTDDGTEIDINDDTTTYNIATLQYCATLDNSPLHDLTPALEEGKVLVDNVSYIAALKAYAESTDEPYHIDNKVRAVEVEKPADTAPAEPAAPDAPAAVSFTDVEEGRWYYDYVQKMVNANIVEGYADGSFKPNDTLTWGAAIKMVVCFVTGEEKAPVEGGNWASGYIAYLKDQGIWTEDIDHNAKISRLELCQVLAKALKIEASEKESTFPDTTDGYVVALVDLGVVGGNPDGTFAPDGELTRAAMCRILASVPDSVKNGEAEAPADAAAAPAEGDAAPTEGDAPAEDAAPAEGDAPADDAAEDAPAAADDTAKAA